MPTSTLEFLLLAKDQASSTFEKVGKSAAQQEGRFKKFRAGASIAAAAVGLGLLKMAGDAVSAASDLDETMSKSQIIFGKNAGQMSAWADNAASAMGLSKKSALDFAASFGDMFSQLGFGGARAADMSKQVVQLAADLGSFNNLPTAEVADMIGGAFRGEYDALQRLVPNISAARVQQEALIETHKKSAKELTAAEKAQATLNIVMNDGKRAAGDFQRTSSGVANQTKIMHATFENLQTSLGEQLIPVMSKLLQVGVSVLTWLEKNPAVLYVLIGALGGLAVAILVANAAFLATPIPWVIIGISALVGAVMYAWTHFEGFRTVVQTVFRQIATVATWLWQNIFVPAWRGIVSAVQTAWAVVSSIFSQLRSGTGIVGAAFNVLKGIFQAGWTIIRGLFQTSWYIVGPILTGIASWVGQRLPGAFATMRAGAQVAWSAIQAVFSWAWNNVLRPVLSGLVGAISTVIRTFAAMLSALGHVPGFGWARDAANQLYGAADAADSLRRQINSIPNTKNITVNYRVNAAQAAATTARLDRIAGYATGGRNIPGGMAWVGERGPELMMIPRGADIYPSSQSRAMASRSDGRDQSFTVNLNLDGKTVQQVLLKVKRTNGGVALGLA